MKRSDVLWILRTSVFSDDFSLRVRGIVISFLQMHGPDFECSSLLDVLARELQVSGKLAVNALDKAVITCSNAEIEAFLTAHLPFDETLQRLFADIEQQGIDELCVRADQVPWWLMGYWLKHIRERADLSPEDAASIREMLSRQEPELTRNFPLTYMDTLSKLDYKVKAYESKH